MKKSIATLFFMLIGLVAFSQSTIGVGIGIIQHPINHRFDTDLVYSIGYKYGFQLSERFELRTGLSLKYAHLEYSTFSSFSPGNSSYDEYDDWKYSANIPLLLYFNPNRFRFYLGASVAINLWEKTNHYHLLTLTGLYNLQMVDSDGAVYRYKNEDFLRSKDSYVAHAGIGYVFYKQLETSLNFSAGNRYQYLTLEVNYCFGKRFKKEVNPPSPL